MMVLTLQNTSLIDYQNTYNNTSSKYCS